MIADNLDVLQLGFAAFVAQEEAAGRSVRHRGVYGDASFVWEGASPLPDEATLRAMGQQERDRLLARERFYDVCRERGEDPVFLVAKAVSGDTAAATTLSDILQAASGTGGTGGTGTTGGAPAA